MFGRLRSSWILPGQEARAVLSSPYSPQRRPHLPELANPGYCVRGTGTRRRPRRCLTRSWNTGRPIQNANILTSSPPARLPPCLTQLPLSLVPVPCTLPCRREHKLDTIISRFLGDSPCADPSNVKFKPMIKDPTMSKVPLDLFPSFHAQGPPFALAMTMLTRAPCPAPSFLWRTRPNVTLETQCSPV